MTIVITNDAQNDVYAEEIHQAMGFSDPAEAIIQRTRRDIHDLRMKAEERVAISQEQEMDVDRTLLKTLIDLDEKLESLDAILGYAEKHIETVDHLYVKRAGDRPDSTLVAKTITNKVNEVIESVYRLIPESKQQSLTCDDDYVKCKQDGRGGWICELARLSCVAATVL